MTTAIENIFSSIDVLAHRADVSRQRAFAAWYAENFFDADEDDVLELVAMDGGEDQGIDLIFADQQTSQIFVIQAHCPENTSKSTPKAKWDAIISAIPAWENPSIFKTQGRRELYEHVVQIKDEFPEYSVVFGLISLGGTSDAIAKSVENTKESKSFKEYDFFYLSQSEIINRYATLIASEKGISEDFLVFENGYLEDQGKFGRAWFGSVSAKELIRLHASYGNKLFAGNVRLFMGSRKGGINEQIIKTAKEEPGLFWALNNGISIVANSAEPLAGNRLKLLRFSIVNGCQTTSCLAGANAVDAKVLVRVISANASVVSDIVQFNNSQNAVKIWSVRSVDDTQERLRSDFEKYAIQYTPKQEGSKKKKDGQKIIELDKLTQFLASGRSEYLIQAINAKTELFDQPYQNLFTHDIKAEVIYLYWRMGMIADRLRQDRLAQLKEEDTDKVSSALLGVSGTYWIVYCTNKLVSSENKTIAAQLRLDKQKGDDFEGALEKYVAHALDMYFDVAIDTYDDETYGSVRSALRSPRFLQKFDQKLNNKLASKVKSIKLPSLSHAIKSAKAD